MLNIRALHVSWGKMQGVFLHRRVFTQMKKETVTTNQITEGVIWKQLLLFFFPIVLGTFFQQLYNTADTIVVGRFVSKEALAAVGGSAAQIVGLIVGFFVGLASGASVIISQFYGAKNRVQLNRALHTAYAFSIIGSIFITVLGILIAPWMLELMHTPQETMADALLYLRIYFAGIIFVFIYNVGSSILRAMGDSRRPLYYLIVCCFLNIVLDIVLVIVFHMGVAGVSIATIFSQGVSAVLITRALMHSDDLYQLEFRKIRFHKAALISLIWVGCPTGIQSVLYSVTNMLIQTFLNNLGTDTVAAREMQFRFMRLGLDMDAVDETHMMRFHSTIVQEDCMAIGISISGRTEEVMECLKQAHRQGAYTVLLTANDRPEYSEFCEEVVCLAAKKNLDFGNIISPQYPILVMTDILYGYYLEIDSSVKQARHDNSVMLLKSRQIQDKDEGGEGKQ